MNVEELIDKNKILEEENQFGKNEKLFQICLSTYEYYIPVSSLILDWINLIPLLNNSSFC